MKKTTLDSIAGWTQCIPIKPPTMPPTSTITTSRKRVFNSVFSASPAPGPFSTTDSPSLKSIDPLATSRSFEDSQLTEPDEPGPDQETWDRAWDAATAFLAVPDRGFAALGAFEDIDEDVFLKRWNRHERPSRKTADALRVLVSQEQRGSIIDWYGQEIRRHFLKNFRNGLFDVGSNLF